MITIKQVQKLKRIAHTMHSSRLELLCVEAAEAIETQGPQAATTPCVKMATREYPQHVATKLGHTMMRCNDSCECTTCGQSGSAIDTEEGLKLRGAIFDKRCTTAIAAEAATRFELLSDEARAYCAEHGADEYTDGLGVAVRDLVAQYCRTWVASLPTTMITVWSMRNSDALAPRFAAALVARGFTTTQRGWCGVTSATIDEIAALAHELVIGVGARIIKREVAP